MQKASKREDCYVARDAYFTCQREEGTGAEPCMKALALYEEKCPGSWRTYFNQQRERQTALELQADISRQRAPPPPAA